MTKLLYGTIITAILLVLAVGVWLFGNFLHPSQSPAPLTGNSGASYNNNTSVSNSAGGTGGSHTSPVLIKIPIQGKKIMSVKDFINNHETAPDTVNPGFYYLAGSIGYCLGDGTCPSGYKTDDFAVTYHETDGMFNITLLTEPLSSARSEAGLFMSDRLGVVPAQLCNLNYWVGTSDKVNAVYAGKNLGFDFCPGAAQLP